MRIGQVAAAFATAAILLLGMGGFYLLHRAACLGFHRHCPLCREDPNWLY